MSKKYRLVLIFIFIILVLGSVFYILNFQGLINNLPIFGIKTISPPKIIEYNVAEQADKITALDPPPIFVVDQKYYATAKFIEMKDGDRRFKIVSLEVPKGTQIRSPWSGEFYHGWGSIMGQSTLGVTVEYPSIKEFQRGISVHAVGLVFKKQDRMVEKGEIIATTDKDGKIFINFYMNLGDNIASRDEETFRYHFPSLFKM
ncbi:MAG: hypothetical protein DDT41_01476 [candidate division WS2 bacterium]|nr:hypothetical protein [Candidatus Psychracetigena formicireducens]